MKVDFLNDCFNEDIVEPLKILIASKERNVTQSTNSGDCVINAQQPILLDKRRRAKLLYVAFFSSIYSINDGNHTVYYGSSSVDIPNGVYSGTSLASALQTAMSIDSVTYSQTTKKFTFTDSGAFTFDWLSAGVAGGNSAYKILGFTTDGITPIDSASATTHVSTIPINLSDPISLRCIIDELDGQFSGLGSGEDFTYYLPIVSGDGGINAYKNNAYFEQIAFVKTIHGKTLNNLRIRFVTQDNTAVDINNSEWEMIIEFSE